MIFCELDLCVYNKDKKCLLKEISVSIEGLCGDCIIPDFPKETIEKSKKQLLDNLNSRQLKNRF